MTFLRQPDLPKGTPPIQIALATIGDSLDKSDFYTCLPAPIVDALLEVAKVAASTLDLQCLCTQHERPLIAALDNLVDTALPI